jgi:hypothetical protein
MPLAPVVNLAPPQTADERAADERALERIAAALERIAAHLEGGATTATDEHSGPAPKKGK